MAFGKGGMVLGKAAQGLGNTALCFGKTAQGFGNTAQGFGNTAQGFGNTAQGFGNTAQGFGNTEQGFGKTAQGFGNTAQGFGNTAQGFGNAAQGFGKTAQGFGRRILIFASGKSLKIEAGLKTNFNFATPHHAWERGSNENTSGLLRLYSKEPTSEDSPSRSAIVSPRSSTTGPASASDIRLQTRSITFVQLSHFKVERINRGFCRDGRRSSGLKGRESR